MKIKSMVLSAAFLICGCSDAAKSKSEPNVRLNSNPEKAYILDLKFLNPPGPLKDVEATAHYRVRDYCTPPLPFSGAVLPPEHTLPLAIKKISNDHYEAAFHQDALRDEDYFGLGVCKWALQNVTVKFKSPSTQFLASLLNTQDQIQSNKAQIEHYLNADYFKKPDHMGIVFGEKADFYLPKLGPQFQAVLSAEKSDK